MKSSLTYLFLLFVTTLFSQTIDQKLQAHQEAYPLEKIYISHNQPFYAAGDTLYGTLFLVNGRTHQYFSGTPIVYVDWIAEDKSVLASHIVKVEDGKANLSISLNRDYGEGRFFLRAYTQYQKNFDDAYIFQKEIKVLNEAPLQPKTTIGDKTAFRVTFFPEGGHLVDGLTSTLAFQAVNGIGEPIDVTGEILNKNKEIIAKFKSFNEGIGVINLAPQAGETYQAQVSWNGLIRTFELPNSLKEGYVLNANNRKQESLSLQFYSNTKNGLKGCTLVGHLRGQPFINQDLTADATQKLLLDKTQIPSGILHFTLFDRKQRPVCERLVFNHNTKEQVVINIDLPKNEFKVKELVEGKIRGMANEKATKGDMTITVYNRDVFTQGTSGINIKNYLLLQSDLKGRINNINQYFEKDDAKSRTLLDYVMLTHGWRRFNWLDVLEEKPTPIIYPTEESLSFAGKIMKNNKNATPIKGDVFLNILDIKNFTSTNLTTEEDGLFYFKGFDLPDSTEILIQGNIHNAKKKGKQKEGLEGRVGNKNVQFELLNLHEIDFNDSIGLKAIPYNKAAQKIFATEVNRIRKVDTIYHPEWTIDLETVTVKAQRIAEERKKEENTRKLFKDRGLFYSPNSQKIYSDDLTAGGAIYLDVYEVIRNQVGGAQVITTAPGVKEVLLRGQSSITNPTYASIELNGTIVTPETAASIVPSDIALIDVKRGLSGSSVYGEAGNGGVITIITKDPANLVRNVYVPGLLNIQHPGYHKARTFYNPDYTQPGWDKTKPDFRTALYWNSTSSLGKKPTPIQFYTGDKFSEFLIFVEGITEDGIPFVGKQSFRVVN